MYACVHACVHVWMYQNRTIIESEERVNGISWCHFLASVYACPECLTAVKLCQRVLSDDHRQETNNSRRLKEAPAKWPMIRSNWRRATPNDQFPALFTIKSPFPSIPHLQDILSVMSVTETHWSAPSLDFFESCAQCSITGRAPLVNYLKAGITKLSPLKLELLKSKNTRNQLAESIALPPNHRLK